MPIPSNEIKKSLQKEKHFHAAVSPNAGLDIHAIADNEENRNALIQLYKANFGGKPGYKEPIEEENKIYFSFPHIGNAEEFFESAAKQGIPMIIADRTLSCVMAYSNGDGQGYHCDGNKFNSGDALNTSNVSLDTFELPNIQILAYR